MRDCRTIPQNRFHCQRPVQTTNPLPCCCQKEICARTGVFAVADHGTIREDALTRTRRFALLWPSSSDPRARPPPLIRPAMRCPMELSQDWGWRGRGRLQGRRSSKNQDGGPGQLRPLVRLGTWNNIRLAARLFPVHHTVSPDHDREDDLNCVLLRGRSNEAAHRILFRVENEGHFPRVGAHITGPEKVSEKKRGGSSFHVRTTLLPSTSRSIS